jgi:hypothetical protein
MRRSEDNPSDRQLVDDDDLVYIQQEIKEMLRLHYTSFEDILAKMGTQIKVPTASGRGNVVTLADFETVVLNIPKAQTKFSNQ